MKMIETKGEGKINDRKLFYFNDKCNFIQSESLWLLSILVVDYCQDWFYYLRARHGIKV